MSFSTTKLKKGGSFAIEKAIAAVLLQLYWDAPEETNGADFDVDGHAFWLTKNSQAISRSGTDYALSTMNDDLPHFDLEKMEITSRRPRKPGIDTGAFCLYDESLIHFGDNLTGGDDVSEQILIDFTKAPKEAEVLEIWLTIYDAERRKQNFGLLKSGSVSVLEARNKNNKMAAYDLKSEFKDQTAIRLVSFMKDDDDNWVFYALGEGFKADFVKMVTKLGFEV